MAGWGLALISRAMMRVIRIPPRKAHVRASSTIGPFAPNSCTTATKSSPLAFMQRRPHPHWVRNSAFGPRYLHMAERGCTPESVPPSFGWTSRCNHTFRPVQIPQLSTAIQYHIYSQSNSTACFLINLKPRVLHSLPSQRPPTTSTPRRCQSIPLQPSSPHHNHPQDILR